MAMLPENPAVLAESSGLALEWPRLRDHIASLAHSPLGREWTHHLEPSRDRTWIDQQQQRTAEIRILLVGGGRFEFHGMFDPTALLDEARLEGVALEGVEINQLLHVIERLAAWRVLLRSDPSRANDMPAIAALSAPILTHDFAPLLQTLRGKVLPDGTLSDDASHELRRIRRAMERQHRAIEESLRKSLRTLAAEGSAQDELITVRGERFVIPVKAELRRRVPGVIHGSSSSGQTVFIEPLETIEQNNELQRLLDEEQREVRRILVALTRSIGESAGVIASGAEVLAEVESHFARAQFAIELNCVRPTFGETLSLTLARHPLLELRLRRTGAAPVPITLSLEEAARQLVISGPNTGGKTVTLKTTGLLALMAQAGLPVPAESATLPLLDAIYADIGDAQSIESNLSSFSAHVVNVDRIARLATRDSLVLLDELGAATDPDEGAALAVAISGYFLRAGAWTCITTHLTAMKVYAAARSGEQAAVLNAAVGFDQATLSPTYELRMGVPGASAGLNIAARLGLPQEIVAAARAQLTTQTVEIGELLDQLHAQLAAASSERARMQIREAELTRERERLDKEGRAEQKSRTRELEAKLNALLEEFTGQLNEAGKTIEDKAAARRFARDSATTIARARREFSSQFNQTVLAHTTGADKTDAAPKSAAKAPPARTPQPGDTVRLTSLGREARVVRALDANQFEVSVGAMKMRVPLADIAEIVQASVPTPLEAARRRGGVTIQTATDNDTVPLEINVIGRTADEAHDEVARYLDRAFLAGLPHVRIVHGTGMGVLRRTLRDYLRGHPNVVSVTEPPYNQGGQGATEVELRQ